MAKKVSSVMGAKLLSMFRKAGYTIKDLPAFTSGRYMCVCLDVQGEDLTATNFDSAAQVAFTMEWNTLDCDIISVSGEHIGVSGAEVFDALKKVEFESGVDICLNIDVEDTDVVVGVPFNEENISAAYLNWYAMTWGEAIRDLAELRKKEGYTEYAIFVLTSGGFYEYEDFLREVYESCGCEKRGDGLWVKSLG